MLRLLKDIDRKRLANHGDSNDYRRSVVRVSLIGLAGIVIVLMLLGGVGVVRVTLLPLLVVAEGRASTKNRGMAAYAVEDLEEILEENRVLRTNTALYRVPTGYRKYRGWSEVWPNSV
jgi:hypothetical protein